MDQDIAEVPLATEEDVETEDGSSQARIDRMLMSITADGEVSK